MRKALLIMCLCLFSVSVWGIELSELSMQQNNTWGGTQTFTNVIITGTENLTGTLTGTTGIFSTKLFGGGTTAGDGTNKFFVNGATGDFGSSGTFKMSGTATIGTVAAGYCSVTSGNTLGFGTHSFRTQNNIPHLEGDTSAVVNAFIPFVTFANRVQNYSVPAGTPVDPTIMFVSSSTPTDLNAIGQNAKLYHNKEGFVISVGTGTKSGRNAGDILFRPGDSDVFITSLTATLMDYNVGCTVQMSTLSVTNALKLPTSMQVPSGTGIAVTASVPAGYELTPRYYYIQVGTDTLIIPAFIRQ